MDPVTLALILRLADLSLWALKRLPERNLEQEEALERIVSMIDSGQMPTQEDFQNVIDKIEKQSLLRDEIIAQKGEN